MFQFYSDWLWDLWQRCSRIDLYQQRLESCDNQINDHDREPSVRPPDWFLYYHRESDLEQGWKWSMCNLKMHDDGRQPYVQLSYIWLRLRTKLAWCLESDINKFYSTLLEDCCNKFLEIRIFSLFQLQCIVLENINSCPWQPNCSGFLWLTFKSGEIYS